MSLSTKQPVSLFNTTINVIVNTIIKKDHLHQKRLPDAMIEIDKKICDINTLPLPVTMCGILQDNCNDMGNRLIRHRLSMDYGRRRQQQQQWNKTRYS